MTDDDAVSRDSLMQELTALKQRIAAKPVTGELKRLKTDLEEEQVRYKSVIHALAEGIVIQLANGTIVTCNASAERILGLTADQMMGRTSLDPRWRAIHEDRSPFPGETHPAMITLRTGKPQSDVIMGVHKPDGSLTWISINSVPMFRDGEAQPYAVVASFTDITAFKKIEHDLRESERNFHLLIDNLDVVFWLHDPISGTPIYISHAVEKLFGLASHVITETPSKFFEVIHPEDRDRLQRQWDEQPTLLQEYRIILPDATVRWILSRRLPIRNEAGVITMYAGFAEDITARKVAEAERQRSEALKQFLADASHDLRTPLTTATNSVYLLKHALGTKASEREGHYLHLVDANLARIRAQLDDMFMLMRLDLSSNFQFRHYDVNRLSQAVADRFAPRLVEKQLQLVIALEPQLPPVKIDIEELSFAISCLLENAINYTDPHGTITMSTRWAGNVAKIAVQDTGIGISPDHLPHIFNRLYRVDQAHSAITGRTGLGLTIAQKIVHMHGGTVIVESTLGVGSSFSILLPFKQP
jgi:PAS domain S-box-containing protein